MLLLGEASKLLLQLLALHARAVHRLEHLALRLLLLLGALERGAPRVARLHLKALLVPDGVHAHLALLRQLVLRDAHRLGRRDQLLLQLVRPVGPLGFGADGLCLTSPPSPALCRRSRRRVAATMYLAALICRCVYSSAARGPPS